MNAIFIYILILISPFLGKDVKPDVYRVQKISRTITLSGTGDDPLWDKASLLTNFHLPWNAEIAQPTTFQGLWDDHHLYFLFKVIDLEMINMPETNRGIRGSDRVGIFFQSDGGMNPYYCLEADPLGRVLDFRANFYRQMEYDWIWPDNGFEIRVTSTDDSFTVEGKISMSSLRSLGIIDDEDVIHAGLFRGDYSRISAERTVARWITWIDPGTKRPDFHISSAFGQLHLVK